MICLTYFTPAFSQLTQSETPTFFVRLDQVSSKLATRSPIQTISLGSDPWMEFEVVPNNVLSEDVKKENPGLATYDVVSKGELIGAFTYFPGGLWASYTRDGKTVTIAPDFNQGLGYHKVEFGKKTVPMGFCQTDHDGETYDLADLNRVVKSKRGDLVTKQEYRMAIVATGEFYAKNGNSAAAANAAITASVNGISAIYNKQYSITFRLTGAFAFNNAATDPFIPDTQMGAMGRTQQAGIEVPKRFNSNLFDIGHVLHNHEDGDGWSNGGLAQLKSVCDNFTSGGQLNKASAWSGAYGNTGYGWLSLFAHEVGHQFGMQHTFNGTGDSCTDAISEETAVEIGSGTTIMSYNGLCQTNNNVPSNGEADNYFHYVSTLEMLFYLLDEVPTCPVTTTSANHSPDTEANPCGAIYEMPKNTPFYLKGNGTDDDGDVIYYAWEQFDEDGAGSPTQGNIGAAAGAKRTTPLFKNFPPSTSNERYFPDIVTVAGGNNSDPFQALPTIDRSINFGFSVRDNKETGGGISYEDIEIQVATTGPLTVTYPNTNENLTAGQNITVTWATNGSDALCNNASIYLSTDGGLTFPVPLATDIPYSAGTANLSIPGFVNNSTTARIKVGCTDYDCFQFYDISNTNFRIQSACSAPQSIICPNDDLSYDKGDPALDLALSNFVGSRVTTFSKRITTSSPSGPSPIYNTSGVGCINKGNTLYNSTIFSVSESGIYTFNVEYDFNDGFGFVTIVNNATYNENSPCNAFISSSGTDAGPQGVSASTVFSANLEECTKYRMLFFNYGTKPINTRVPSFSGPGIVMEEPTTPNADFGITYMAVRNSNNIIALVSSAADFRALGPGTYTIYGVTFKSAGTTPPNITDLQNYVGQKFNEFYIQGDCFLPSFNSFQLEIKGSCSLESAILGQQTPCNPLDNSFTQEIVLTYSTAAGDSIVIGNNVYAITSSPQTILFTGNANGSTTFLDAYFREEANCRYTVNITHPENCCPFEIGVDDIERGCEGQPLTVEANDGLGTYEWKAANGTVIGSNSAVTLNTEGTYTVKVTSPTGCVKTKEFQAIFEPTPTVTLPADLTICDGVDYLLIANTTASFLEWYKDGVLIQSGPQKNITLDTAGVFSVKAGNSAACQVTDEINIAVNPSPQPNLGNDKNICEGQSTTLSINDNGNITWFLDNVAIPNQTGKTINVSTDGVYKVVVMFPNGCTNEDIVNVNVFALPTVDAGGNLTFCEGKDVTINATSSSQIFEWFKDGVPYSAIDLSFVTNQPGKYKIVASNDIGCKVADSLIVTRNLLPVVNLGTDKTGCINSDVPLTGPTGNNYQYQWFFNGTAITGGQSIDVSNPGTYSLQVTDANNCSNIDFINVDFKPGPSVLLSDVNIEICDGETYNLEATTTATKIEWLRNGQVIAGQTGKILAVTQAGTYTIKATGSVGGGSECTVEEVATAIVNPVLAVNIRDTTACEGTPITITSNVTAFKYTWKLGNAVVANTKSYSPTTAGTYTLEVETQKGCKSSDNAIVTFSARPSVLIPATGEYCKGQSLNITGQSNGNTFRWLQNNQAIAGATSLTYVINKAGTYVLEATFNGACPRTDTIVVTERALPVVGLGADKTLCPNDSIVLDAGNAGSTYDWSNGAESQKITIKNNGIAGTTTLNLIVTNTFGCTAKDTIAITNRPVVNVNLAASAPGICGGDSVTLTATGGLTYTWEGPQGSFDLKSPDKIIVFPSSTATYKVIAGDDCPGNRDTASREIKLFPLPAVSAGGDTCVILGRTIKLKATGGAFYTWEADATIVSGANTSSPVVQPEEPTTYVVSIKDVNGCIQTDSVSVCIIEDPLSLLKPVDAITPNADGFNDNLEFIGLEAFPDNSLIIYNRWGSIVYEKLRYQTDGERFDGTRNGEELPPDTYYYVLKFEDLVFKSALTIVREK